MKLESVQLKQFRTYENQVVEFPKRLTLITGENASGKTNILESISLISNGKSFRGAVDNEMVRAGTSHYFVSGSFLRSGKKFEVDFACELSGNKSKKKIKINDKVLSGRSALIGNLITVIFSPSDISIIEGGPAQRRRFLDSLLSRQNKNYLIDLIQYNRALRQRNSIIKNIREKKANKNDLHIWNPGIVKFAEKIIRERVNFIEEFYDIFKNSMYTISNSRDDLNIRLEYSSEKEKSNYEAVLLERQERDIQVGYTTTGPHRHNLVFELNGRDIEGYGSQGQKRSTALALRIAEFYFLKQKLGLSPVLLIDDVIRELDAKRRSSFIHLLHECGQAIFTTPDLDGLEDFLNEMRRDISILYVENGSVKNIISEDEVKN